MKKILKKEHESTEKKEKGWNGNERGTTKKIHSSSIDCKTLFNI